MLCEIQHSVLTKFDIKIKTLLILLIFIIVKERNIEIFFIVFNIAHKDKNNSLFRRKFHLD